NPAPAGSPRVANAVAWLLLAARKPPSPPLRAAWPHSLMGGPLANGVRILTSGAGKSKAISGAAQPHDDPAEYPAVARRAQTAAGPARYLTHERPSPGPGLKESAMNRFHTSRI